MTMAASLPVSNSWINDRFGSKKGLLDYGLFEAKRITGLYKSLEVEKHIRPERLVFVCVGNICRSPLAEAVARSRGYNAISFGLATRGNDGADPRAVQFGKKYDLDLTNHRTRRINDYKEQKGDIFIGMEPKHLKFIREQKLSKPFTLLGLYASKPIAYIHDPFNTNQLYFTRCEQTVMEATEAFLDYVQ